MAGLRERRHPLPVEAGRRNGAAPATWGIDGPRSGGDAGVGHSAPVTGPQPVEISLPIAFVAVHRNARLDAGADCSPIADEGAHGIAGVGGGSLFVVWGESGSFG